MPGNKSPHLFYGYIVAVAAFSLLVAAFGTYFSYGIFFTPLLTEFGWSKAITSGAYSLSVWLQGSLGIIAGRLGDRFGPRAVTTTCGILLGLGYLLVSQVSTVWQLYLFYGLIIGIGMSGWWPTLLPLIARWFVKRRGVMTGIVASGIGLGTMIVPPLANWLISSYDWRIAYITTGIASLVLVAVAVQFLKHSPRQLGLVPYGEEVAKENQDMQLSGLPFPEVVRRRQFWMLFVMYLCHGFFLFTIMVHIVPHAIELGISATGAAYILAIIGWISFISRIVMGGIADQIGNRQCLVISFIVMSLTLLWLLVASEAWMFYLFAAVFGFSYAGLSSLQSLIAAEFFGLRSLGVIVGSLTFGFTVGGAIGPAVAGGMFDVIGSYIAVFLICITLSVVGLMLSVLLLTPIGRVRGRNDWKKATC